MANVSSRQRFPQNQDIRLYQVRHKPVSRTAEARCDLVKDEQHAVLIAKLPRTLQERDIVHPHPSCALEQRLRKKTVQPVMIL